MEAIFGVVWLVFICSVVGRIVKSAKSTENSKGPVKNNGNFQQFTTVVQNGPSSTSQKAKASSFETYSSNKSYSGLLSLKDDRENDWFAKQLREEHLAFKRTSEMFNLKIEHASVCDARMLADFHASHCEAKDVDRAEA